MLRKKCTVLMFGLVFAIGLYALRSVRLSSNVVVPDNNSRDAVCSLPLGVAQFSTAWLRREFVVFAAVYAQRPAENSGGTKLPHQFALWATVRRLQPETIVESGVYRGKASWLMRQAAPKARLILLEPYGEWIEYRDNHTDTVYLTDKNFVDFSRVDWPALSVDPSRTFVFFDDHQSGVKRTLQAWRAGFKFMMFDDNSVSTSSDNFSLKQACLLKAGPLDRESVKFKDNFGHTNRALTDEDLMLVDITFDQVIDIYYEFPFIYKDTGYTREVLFPNDTYTDIKAKYRLPDSGDKYAAAAMSYYNACFVALKALPVVYQ